MWLREKATIDTPITDRLRTLKVEFEDLLEAADEIDRLRAENERLRQRLQFCVAIQLRVQGDTYWRTPDNTLWPDLVATTRNAQAAVLKGDPDAP